MSIFKRLALLIILAGILAGCKGRKKASLAGDDPVDISDFIAFFQPRQLPYQFTDSILSKKEKDSLLISYKVFTQFVPDSILSKVFGKGIKPKIYPFGKVSSERGGVILFTKAITTSKKAAFIIAFNDKKEFLASLPILRSDQTAGGTRTVTIDRRFTVTRTMQRRNKDGTQSEGRDVYSLSEETRDFALVMTDALEDKPTELINPIDTLPRKHKLSADYVSGKMNIVSIRDGRKPDRLSFFIHFEKSNGQCIGELKGDALIKSSTTAEYRENGDPCILKFIFSSGSVTLKEQEGCGAHRGLRCAFDGTFPKKKYVKPATTIQPTRKKTN
jgi:hypothetical protein